MLPSAPQVQHGGGRRRGGDAGFCAPQEQVPIHADTRRASCRAGGRLPPPSPGASLAVALAEPGQAPLLRLSRPRRLWPSQRSRGRRGAAGLSS